MNIRTEDENMDEPRTLKVTIPTRLHLRLHSLKILTGTTISEVVEEAVEAFFEGDAAVEEATA